MNDRCQGPRPHGAGEPGLRRLRSIPIIALAAVALVTGTMPVVAAPMPAAGPDRPPLTETDPGTGFGDPVTEPPLECPAGGCPETATTTGGEGGFIAAAAETVLDTRAAPAKPLGKGESRAVQVGGAGSVPATGIQAVVLEVVASQAIGWSSLVVWPTGATRPAEPSLDVQPDRAQRATVVVPLGTDGKVSVWNERGTVDVAIDVIGWFAWDSEYRAVTPTRLLDTNPGSGGRPAPIAPNATVNVAVADTAGVPAGARAVVLHLASRTSTTVSAVTVWPKGLTRPAQASLVAQPNDRRDNLAIVPIGADGAVSVWNQSGWTHLTIDLVGWLPAAASYRALTPATLLDPASRPDGIAAGATLDVVVAGVGGVPDPAAEGIAETAYAVALNVTVTPRAARATTVTAWPKGDEQPANVTVASTANTSPTTSLTIVRVGNDGKVSIANGATAADLRVDVVGWFAAPIVAAQLEIPDTTVAPEASDTTLTDLVTEPAPDPADPPQVVQASLRLAPDAPDVQPGGHIVLGPGGVTPTAQVTARLAVDDPVGEAFPEGFLGEITSVETLADGTQQVVAVPAMLQDAFPEGDIEVNLAADTDYEAQLLYGANRATDSIMLASVAPPTSGVKVDFEYLGDGKKGKDPSTSVECSMDGIYAKFGPLINMQFSVRWRWLKAPVVTALATLGAQAELGLKDISVKCGIDIKLWKATVTFTAGPVPVVVVFDVGAELDISAGLHGLDLSASAEAYVTIGVKDNRGYADAGYDFHTTNLADLAPQLTDLNVYGQSDTWIKFGVKLYGVIGPRISVGPFVEVAISNSAAQPWWRIDFGLAGRIELSLDLWFHEWNWNLYEAEIPLADLLGVLGILENCPAMPYDPLRGPCKSAKPIERADGSRGDRVLASRIRLASAGRPMQVLAINVPAPVPSGDVGQPYSVRLTADGLFDAADQVAWALRAPDLPWLTLTQDGADAVLSGIPPASGTFVANVDLSQAWAPVNVRDTEAITIGVGEVNAPPRVDEVSLIVSPNAGPRSLALAASDAETAADELQFTIATLPQHGTLARAGTPLQAGATFDGSPLALTYQPSAGYAGPDAFTYTVNDRGNPSGCTPGVSPCAPPLTSGLTTATITVANQPPVAFDDAYAVRPGETLSVGGGGVLANDVDPDGDALAAALVTGPAHAAAFALATDGSFTYQPVADFSGPDTFRYRADDGFGGTAEADATIQVTTNTAPVCTGVGQATEPWDVEQGHGFAAAIDCIDTEGDELTFAVATPPGHGEAQVIGGDTFEYTAPLDYLGPDSFTGVANDGMLDSAPFTFWINVIEPLPERLIINGGFEGGDLSGWTLANPGGRAEVSNWFNYGASVGPSQGAWFGLLGAEGQPVSISQTFTANEGDTISGMAWTFPGGGTATVRILDVHGDVVATLIGDSTWPSWVRWSHTFPDYGVYSIVAEVTGTSYLGLDEVTLTAPLTNGGFESQDLWGWTVSENPGRAEASGWFVIGGQGVVPAGGEWFGVVGTRVEGDVVDRDTTLSQAFWADAGDTLSGKAWSNSGGATLRIVDSNGTTVATLLAAATWPDWITWTHTLAAPGVYRLVAETTGTFTFLGLDVISLTP